MFSLFHRPTQQIPPAQVAQAEQRSTIEIVAHKEAKAEVVAQAEAVSKHLNKLLVDNGFTLKIFLAAGGQHPQKRTRGNHA